MCQECASRRNTTPVRSCHMTLRLAPIVLIVAACGLAGPGASSQPTASQTPSPAPTALPTATPAFGPTDPPAHTDQPPTATLAGGGDPVIGQLGTYCRQ